MAIGKIKLKSQAHSLTSDMLICNMYTPSMFTITDDGTDFYINTFVSEFCVLLGLCCICGVLCQPPSLHQTRYVSTACMVVQLSTWVGGCGVA